jgi:quercetin dioxygenase-like cupin family protein
MTDRKPLCYSLRMVVIRWQAPIIPTIEQIKMIMVNEGLEPVEETLPSQGKIKEHRHPFDEIRMVVDGELLVNVSGNQLMLRAGDRIEIPSNTKHHYHANGSSDCICVIAQRPPF